MRSLVSTYVWSTGSWFDEKVMPVGGGGRTCGIVPSCTAGVAACHSVTLKTELFSTNAANDLCLIINEHVVLLLDKFENIRTR